MYNLSQSIFPIIYYDDNRCANVAGSAFLVENNDVPFLLTAAHVLRDVGSKFQPFLLLHDKAIRLHEPAFMSPINKIDGSDNIDVGCFPIQPNKTLATHLQEYKTISLQDYPYENHLEKEIYFAYGFPWRSAKYNKSTREIWAPPIQYFADFVENLGVYKKYKKSSEDHIIIKYNQKQIFDQNGKKKMPPKPHGVSGGPIFRALLNENNVCELVILEGLLTNWEDNQWMIATRKKTIKNFIETK